MPSLLRAPLLALLPALLLGAAPPAASKPASGAAPVHSAPTVAAPAKNASANATQANATVSKATVKLASKPAAVATAAIGVSSKIKTPIQFPAQPAQAAGSIVTQPKTGAMVVPKTIQRHVQNGTLDHAVGTAKARLRANRDIAAGHLAFMNASDMIRQAAAECECHFDDHCACHTAMEFMTCVMKACVSGGCDCKKYEFMGACGAIANTCPELAISCGKERSECISEEVAVAPQTIKVEMPMPKEEKKVEEKEEPEEEGDEGLDDELKRDEYYDELRELKERKCQLEVAVNDGWLNAERSLKETNAEIEEKLDWLISKGFKVPEMHCQKHFEEWHDSPSVKPTAPPAPKEPEPEPEKEPKAAAIKSEPGEKPKVPLWSAPTKGAAAREACPLLLIAGLMAAALA